MELPPSWLEIINNEKVSGGKRGCGGRDNILEDGLSLFCYCPLMIGFARLHICLFLRLPSYIDFLHYCRALCSTSLVVILWLDLGLCCLSQFVHFVWQGKGEKGNSLVLAQSFPPGLCHISMNGRVRCSLLVFISDLFVIGLDIWYSWDLALFPDNLFSRVSFSLFNG